MKKGDLVMLKQPLHPKGRPNCPRGSIGVVTLVKRKVSRPLSDNIPPIETCSIVCFMRGEFYVFLERELEVINK